MAGGEYQRSVLLTTLLSLSPAHPPFVSTFLFSPLRTLNLNVFGDLCFNPQSEVSHFGLDAVPDGMVVMAVPRASAAALAEDTAAFNIPRDWLKRNAERQWEADLPWGSPPHADGLASAPQSDPGLIEVYQEEKLQSPEPAIRHHRDSVVLRYQARNRADHSRLLPFRSTQSTFVLSRLFLKIQKKKKNWSAFQKTSSTATVQGPAEGPDREASSSQGRLSSPPDSPGGCPKLQAGPGNHPLNLFCEGRFVFRNTLSVISSVA